MQVMEFAGEVEGNGSSGYLLPSDVEIEHADFSTNETLLPMETVFETFENLAAHHTLLILDCCFAGTFRHVGKSRLGIGLGFSPDDRNAI